MTEERQPDTLRAVFTGAFRKKYEESWAKAWRRDYVEFVQSVRDASLDQWMQPSFQEKLGMTIR